MIKTHIDDNELVTKGFLRITLQETINEAINGLAQTINKSFINLEFRMAKQEDLLTLLTERVKSMEEQLNGHGKDIKGMHNNFHLVFGELRAIRDRLDRIEKNDVTADVVALDLRLKKLEKKAGLQ